jgi:EAL domain-containing protein (putative c-di-GMP-specific phosphodiesterase class I)
MEEPFLERMDSELAGWTDPVRRLHDAIENDEFELYCQPILQFAGNDRYPMAEVLVRLREEERALLPPGEFLPVFEHYRMMAQLDRWVVRHTVKRLSQGSRVPRFTVNLSGQTLEDEDFPRFVSAQLSVNQVPAEKLLFEIDESDALLRLGACKRFANAYRALGGQLLIDGFGNRAVSFTPVRELGVKFVKADGSICRKVLSSESARHKLDAMLRVGQTLGYAIVAECVEDQDVLLRLKAMGVAYAQGFGIYQPHPIEVLAQV